MSTDYKRKNMFLSMDSEKLFDIVKYSLLINENSQQTKNKEEFL